MTSTINEAGRLLGEGKLVAFPTETVYGLGANALDRAAVRRIYEVKGRPSTSPLIVHVATVEAARSLAAVWPDNAERLANAFWPGPLTIIVRKNPVIPDEVTAGLDTVGIRVPAHPVALEVLRAASVPVAAPSANLFSQLSPTTAGHVHDGLGDRVDLIVDGGPCVVGIESTVVSVVDNGVLLLRPGMVSKAQLEAVVGVVTESGEVAAGASHPSPGMHQKHYSPRSPLQLGLPEDAACGYLWHTVARPAQRSLQLPAEAHAYAAGLYSALHELDHAGVAIICVEPVPDGEEWQGIADRLARAARA